jgi:hypothetical protein
MGSPAPLPVYLNRKVDRQEEGNGWQKGPQRMERGDLSLDFVKEPLMPTKELREPTNVNRTPSLCRWNARLCSWNNDVPWPDA